MGKNRNSGVRYLGLNFNPVTDWWCELEKVT